MASGGRSKYARKWMRFEFMSEAPIRAEPCGELEGAPAALDAADMARFGSAPRVWCCVTDGVPPL